MVRSEGLAEDLAAPLQEVLVPQEELEVLVQEEGLVARQQEVLGPPVAHSAQHLQLGRLAQPVGEDSEHPPRLLRQPLEALVRLHRHLLLVQLQHRVGRLLEDLVLHPLRGDLALLLLQVDSVHPQLLVQPQRVADSEHKLHPHLHLEVLDRQPDLPHSVQLLPLEVLLLGHLVYLLSVAQAPVWVLKAQITK